MFKQVIQVLYFKTFKKINKGLYNFDKRKR